jgi:hypothetical protein
LGYIDSKIQQVISSEPNDKVLMGTLMWENKNTKFLFI